MMNKCCYSLPLMMKRCLPLTVPPLDWTSRALMITIRLILLMITIRLILLPHHLFRRLPCHCAGAGSPLPASPAQQQAFRDYEGLGPMHLTPSQHLYIIKQLESLRQY